MNCCGHGSVTSWSATGISNTNVNALTNENRLPFIFGAACVNMRVAGGVPRICAEAS